MSGEGSLRLDRWLCHARFAKTRAVAARMISGGKVRVNARKVTKVSATVVPGDTLTLSAHGEVRVVRILGLPDRRGSATVARALYEDVGAEL